jgi:hypothetical protein
MTSIDTLAHIPDELSRPCQLDEAHACPGRQDVMGGGIRLSQRVFLMYRVAFSSTPLRRCLSEMTHSESQISEHLDGAALAALEVSRGKPLAGSELVRSAQDCLRRVAALLPDQLVRRGRGEPMVGEECCAPSRSYSAIARTTSSRLTWFHAIECAIGPSHIVVTPGRVRP